MPIVSSDAYKAEMFVVLPEAKKSAHIVVNGGCGFLKKYKSSLDYLIEEVHLRPALGSKIIARWTPSSYKGTPHLPEAAAIYQEDGKGYIRFDNAHDRTKIHLDMDFAGVKREHSNTADIRHPNWIDPRRVALVSLFSLLERMGYWRIPVQFYMPICVWWPEYDSLPHHVMQKKPGNVSMTSFCEALMLYASLSPDTARAFQFELIGSSEPVHALLRVADTVANELSQGHALRYRIHGEAVILPFPIMAPPGARVSGNPKDLMMRLRPLSNP